MQTANGNKMPARRRFLQRALALGGSGALLVLGAERAQAGPAAGGNDAGPRPRQGYRLTEHIRRYYDSTRS